MNAEIIVRTPDGAAKVVQLKAQRLTVGRAATNDLCFPADVGLSRQHMAFERDGEDWMVTDVGSRNGTFLNGTRLTHAAKLSAGDKITAGHLQFDFNTEQDRRVVFVDSVQQEAHGATIVASLDSIFGTQQHLISTVAAGVPMTANPQMQALIRAGRELAGHMPLSELFPLILDLAVDAVGASRGVLMALEGDGLVVRAVRGDGFEISKTVRDRVLKHKESILVRDVSLDEQLRSQMSIVLQRVRSMIAVPLQTNETVIGLIYVDSPNMVREFTAEDLSLLTVMANVAAIRIEHARLNEIEQHEKIMAKELEQAAEIQRNLLPVVAPVMVGMEVAGYNAACRTVGGDYYDFFLRPGNKMMMLVGDVAGKGLPAALLMTSLQARVQVLAEEPVDLASLVTRLNRVIASNCPGNRFITFFICELDPASGEITYCNAGHNPPLLVRCNGEVERLEGGGIVLGIMGGFQFTQHVVNLGPGDLLAMFSDGVTEAEKPGSEEDFGEDRLAQILAANLETPIETTIETVRNAVADFTNGAPAADDFTLVVARRNAA